MRVGEEQSKGLNSLGGRGEGNQDTGSPDSHLIPLETGGKGDPPVAVQRPPLRGEDKHTDTPHRPRPNACEAVVHEVGGPIPFRNERAIQLQMSNPVDSKRDKITPAERTRSCEASAKLP